MSRTALALALCCLTPSLALAKDLCVQVDAGSYAGSHFVLKKCKLARSSTGPLHGYLARYSQATFTYSLFYPIDGESIVNGRGDVALGIALHDAVVSSNGTGTGQNIIAVNITCQSGSDGKIGVLDPCDGFVGGQSTTGHVIECKGVAPIP